MKQFTITLLLFIISITAHGVNVAAASNLKLVMEEMKTVFIKQHSNINIYLTFGSSGMLTQQIINGANFDLFLSADKDCTHKIIEHKLNIGDLHTYAFGKLVLYSTSVDVVRLGMKSLNDTKVHKIAIANPSLASYGKSTIEVLKRINQYQSVQKKLVIAENISQCSQYLISGNAEIGFTALSLAMSYDMSSKGSYFIVPDRYYTPIEQTCLLIKTPNPTSEAVLFQKFILSAAAKVIWKKYGYGVP